VNGLGVRGVGGRETSGWEGLGRVLQVTHEAHAGATEAKACRGTGTAAGAAADTAQLDTRRG